MSTKWTVGEHTQIRWDLTEPKDAHSKASIYIVGGDSTAFTRLKFLGNVTLSHNSLKLTVPNVSCESTCAIEYRILNGTGDYYSHSFTILPASPPHATAGSPVDNSVTGPKGPITQVQSTAKGAQSQSGIAQVRSNANIHRAGPVAIVVGAVATTVMILFF
ncbi:hypothetical protein BGZ98_008784 [Dissophora globulifera]|nr:hypothetical protein BGZ98_008784 [Dissophora globulifera]